MDYRMTEKLETCPYNSSHQILPHRMAMHLIKCKKNYPNAAMKVCIFNAVHVVPIQQYQAHLLECEDRKLVERDLYSFQHVGKKTPVTKDEPVLKQHGAANSEDWEADCVQTSYSPENHVIYKEFTRAPPPGLSKGARKQWRQKEIERVNRLKNGMPVGVPQSNGNTCAPVSNDWAVGGAIPKNQGDFKNVSRGESVMGMDQIAHKYAHPDAAAFISSIKQSSQNAALGNHIDKRQNPKSHVNMSDFIKEKRKLEKKLFEIKKLENMKVNLNEKLTDEEEAKIASKETIEEKLSNLMAAMSV